MGAVRKSALAGLTLALVLVVGCSDPYAGRVAVSGTVKFKGEPLKYGVILFEPMEKQDTTSGAPIANGKYDIPRSQGLKAGKYRLRVTAGDGVTPAASLRKKTKEGEEEHKGGGPGGSTNIISKELIPPTWNSATQQTVTIEGSGPNTKDFDIPAK
jgi:hypothetical protein